MMFQTLIPGTVLNGIYRIDDFIARGGMGVVFAGVNIETKDRVAIKVVTPHLSTNPKILAKVRSEARLLTQVVHPAVVPYRVFARDPVLRIHYIVTDLVVGDVLADRIGKKKISVDDLLTLLRRLAEGLRAIHDVGVIHCDVAPDNVLLPAGRMEQARIVDLGIAKSLTLDNSTNVLEGFAGKLGYGAPEQFGIGDWKIGPWTDVYGLGLVALSAAMNRPADMGATLAEAVDRRLRLPPLDDVASPIRGLLRDMLSPNPAQRLASMDEVLRAIDDIRLSHADGDEPTTERVAPTDYPPQPKPRRKRQAVLLLSAMLLGTALTGSSQETGGISSVGDENYSVVDKRAPTGAAPRRKEPGLGEGGSQAAKSGPPRSFMSARPSTRAETAGNDTNVEIRAGGTPVVAVGLASPSPGQTTRSAASARSADAHAPLARSILAQKPVICRQYDSAAWRNIGTMSVSECVRRGFMRREINYLQVGPDVLVRHHNLSSSMRGNRRQPEPLIGASATAEAGSGSVEPYAKRSDFPHGSSTSRLLGDESMSCRRYQAPEWRTIGTFTASECVRRALNRQGTVYLQVGADVLLRQGDQLFVMNGKKWLPVRFAGSRWDRAVGGEVRERAESNEFASEERYVCRHFDGSSWKTLGRVTMRACAERAFARPGVGFVKVGESLLTMRAKRIGVWQSGRWHPVARLYGDVKSTVKVVPL